MYGAFSQIARYFISINPVKEKKTFPISALREQGNRGARGGEPFSVKSRRTTGWEGGVKKAPC